MCLLLIFLYNFHISSYLLSYVLMLGIHVLLYKTYQQGCSREFEAVTTLCQAVTNSQPMCHPVMQEK
jgi:hypothetical protein